MILNDHFHDVCMMPCPQCGRMTRSLTMLTVSIQPPLDVFVGILDHQLPILQCVICSTCSKAVHDYIGAITPWKVAA